MTPAALARSLVDDAWRRGLAIDRAMTVSEWADRHRKLPGANAEPGPWRTDRVPYLRAIMDDLSTGSPVERVVLMKGAQTGGTEAGLNAVGYWIDHAPGLILAVWPSIDMVRRNSRTRIEPLLTDTPSLKAKIVAPKTKEPGNTISLKEFPGGALVMTGANAATGLRSTPARYLVLDEVDAFPSDVGDEGDPVALAIQRTVTFRGRRKILLISTPTLAGASRIERAYLESDQRRWFVPCRHCAEPFVIEWQHIRWPEGEPHKAFCACPHCGGVHAEHDKGELLAKGAWRATAAGDGRTRGYHVPALLSPFEAWGEIAADFLVSKQDPVRLKTWVNLKLGEAFEDRDTAPLSADVLASRGEDWGDDVPERVALLTAGVDVQDDRLEVEIVGWGRAEESWSLAYEIIAGDTSRPEPWAALDALLTRRWRHARAVPDLAVAAVAVDSGGHRTGEVMAYSAARLQRRVWAIKGRGGPGVPPWPRRPPKPLRAHVAPLHIVGVDSLKSAVYARLRAAAATGPGACHFPADREAWWFAGLTAERCIRRFVAGRPKLEWVHDKGTRNEPLDCRVYASAALAGLAAAGVRLDDLADALAKHPLRASLPPDAPPAAPARKAVIPSRWMAR